MKQWNKPKIEKMTIKKITLSGSGADGECGNSGAKKKCNPVTGN